MQIGITLVVCENKDNIRRIGARTSAVAAAASAAAASAAAARAAAASAAAARAAATRAAATRAAATRAAAASAAAASAAAARTSTSPLAWIWAGRGDAISIYRVTGVRAWLLGCFGAGYFSRSLFLAACQQKKNW